MCYVFEWDQYYPCGGWNDHKRTFGTFDEAKEYHKENPLEAGQRRQVVCGGCVMAMWRDDD